MNIRIQLRLMRDCYFRNIILSILCAVNIVVLTIAVTGFSNYKHAAGYFIDSFEDVYIYKYDSTLFDMNNGRGYGVAELGMNDYSSIMQKRESQICNNFDVKEILVPSGRLYLYHYPLGKTQPENMVCVQTLDYSNSLFRNIPIDITEGRLPYEDEANVILLPNSYKTSFECNQTYEFSLSNSVYSLVEDGYEYATFDIKVIGFFDNPILLDSNLEAEMDNNVGIIYLPEEVSKDLCNSSTTLFIQANSVISDEAMREFMTNLHEDPDNFRHCDPAYEYEGQKYNLKKDAETLRNKVLLSVVFLFVTIIAGTYFGLDRINYTVKTFMRIGLSRNAAIGNILLNKLLVIIPGILAGIIIYKTICDGQYVIHGGITVSEFYWNTKCAVIAVLLVLAGCLIAHIPFIVKVLSVELQREE